MSRALGQKADYSAVRAVGVDETASRRGQRYITLFHDFDGQRLLFACEGRDQGTVEQFAHDLTEHGGDPKEVCAVCMDMSAAYQAGARKHLPNAEITFDAFHVIQLANEALEQVRRAEVKSEPGLRHSRWIWLKDRSRWNMRQINQFHDLRRSRLKTTRAWHLKESLRELYACAADREHAAILIQQVVPVGAPLSPRAVQAPGADTQEASAGRAQRLRLASLKRPRRGHQLPHPSGQGPRTWLPNLLQPDHHGLPHRRQARPPSSGTVPARREALTGASWARPDPNGHPHESRKNLEKGLS
jgi:hypothetical protein